LAVCVRHLMPNIAPVVIAQAAINFGYVMVDLAAVSYLGLGVQPPSADWGLMISEGQATIISGAPEQALWASAMFVVAVIAFNVLADALANRISGGPR
jgi:peptide/nickel transport system permease protein